MFRRNPYESNREFSAWHCPAGRRRSHLSLQRPGVWVWVLFFWPHRTGPILLILLAVLFLGYFLTGRKVCLWLCLLTILGLIVAMVLGTSFHIQTKAALDLGLILGMTVAGLGLFLRGLLGLKK